MLKEIPVCIYRKLQLIIFNGTPNWITIKANENCGCVAQEYLGWIRFQTFNVFWSDLVLMNSPQHSIQRHEAILVRNGLFDLVYYRLCLLFRKRRKVCLNNLQR